MEDVGAPVFLLFCGWFGVRYPFAFSSRWYGLGAEFISCGFWAAHSTDSSFSYIDSRR